MWLAASVKIDKKSLSAMYNPVELVYLDLRVETIAGKMLSMVCDGISAFD
jgi:hypothetical protein